MYIQTYTYKFKFDAKIFFDDIVYTIKVKAAMDLYDIYDI